MGLNKNVVPSLVVLTMACAGVASAQEGDPVAAEPGAEAAEVEADQTEQDDPRFEEARDRFVQGLALSDAGNCAGAIAEFNASLAILPRPNTLFNIARCQETLNRYDLALRDYEAYMELAEADDPDRPTVEATMRQLRNLLGTIHVSSNVPAEVWLGDRIVGEAPGDVLVPGGRHLLELRAEGRVPERREVEVAARGEVSVEIELSAAEVHQHTTTTTNVSYEAPPLPSWLTISMIGISAATLGVGTYFGINAVVLSNEEQDRDPRLPRDADAVDQSALLADVFLIAGGVLAAATIAMAFLTDWGGGQNEEDSEAARTGLRITPLIGPLFAGIRVEGFE